MALVRGARILRLVREVKVETFEDKVLCAYCGAEVRGEEVGALADETKGEVWILCERCSSSERYGALLIKSKLIRVDGKLKLEPIELPI